MLQERGGGGEGKREVEGERGRGGEGERGRGEEGGGGGEGERGRGEEGGGGGGGETEVERERGRGGKGEGGGDGGGEGRKIARGREGEGESEKVGRGLGWEWQMLEPPLTSIWCVCVGMRSEISPSSEPATTTPSLYTTSYTQYNNTHHCAISHVNQVMIGPVIPGRWQF